MEGLRVSVEGAILSGVARSGRSRVRRWGFWGWGQERPKWTEPMPDWVEAVRLRVDAQLARGPSDSVSLNEFMPGKGVSPHVDSNVFEDEIAVVSLGEGTLRLYRADPRGFRTGGDPGPVVRDVLIPTGSLYVMTRPVVHSFTAGAVIRYSAVFRRTRVRA